MNKKFLTSFIIPEKWDIAGYELRPYSIRKHLNLAAADSPYLNGQVPSALETLQFLKWCSSDNKSIIDKDPVTLRDIVAYIRIKYDVKFHAYIIKAASVYMTECSAAPSYRIVDLQTNSSTSKNDILVDKNSLPEMLTLTSVCMAKLGMKEDEVLDAPIGKLTWYAAAAALIAGADVRLNDVDEPETEKEILEKWEKEQAEVLRLAMVNGKIPKKKIKIRGQ